MTELSFLLSLLLDQKLNREVKGLIKERIKEIETAPRVGVSTTRAISPTGQSASTQKILDEMAEEGKSLPIPVHIAQTPQAAMALASRQQAISQAISGQPEKGRTQPRKF
jgi:hypothetical protein